MRSILHIGMHRTGTTSVQETCFAHRAALADQKIVYPCQGTIWGGHHQFAWSLIPGHPGLDPGFDLDRALDEIIQEAPDRTLILSSEDFEYAPPDRISRILAPLARRGDVEVVCYFRHPAEWVESAFKWHAMRETGRFMSLADYVENISSSRWLDYKGLAERWSSGPAKFRARLYRPAIVEDFLTVAGAVGIAPNASANVSVRNISAKIATSLSAMRTVSVDLVRKIDNDVTSHTDQDIALMDEHEYETLMSRLEEKTKSFIDEFLPDGDALLARRWRPGTMSKAEEVALTEKMLARYR